MKIEQFLSTEQENEIASAIEKAESGTTGEIRVHIERRCKEDPLHRAIQLFSELGMHQTRFHNGVLIYISTTDKKLAIYGDDGIHSIVGDEFWHEDIKVMANQFKTGNYTQGIIEVIQRVGEKLAIHFPTSSDPNPDELDNAVSFGE